MSRTQSPPVGLVPVYSFALYRTHRGKTRHLRHYNDERTFCGKSSRAMQAIFGPAVYVDWYLLEVRAQAKRLVLASNCSSCVATLIAQRLNAIDDP